MLPLFVNWATLLQMSLEVVQDSLPTALEGNQYPLAKNQRVYWLPSDKSVLFVKVANTLRGICQRVANTL
jgi:hypothetical protein